MLGVGDLEVGHRPAQRGGDGGERPGGLHRHRGVARRVDHEGGRADRGRMGEQVEPVEVDADPPTGEPGGERGQRGRQLPDARLLAQGGAPVHQRGVPHERRHPRRQRRARQQRPDDGRPHRPADEHDLPRASCDRVRHRGLDVEPLGVAEVVVAVGAGGRFGVVAVAETTRAGRSSACRAGSSRRPSRRGPPRPCTSTAQVVLSAPGTNHAGHGPSGAAMSTSVNASPRAAGSGSNVAASSIARPTGGGGPASSGRTTPLPSAERTGPTTAKPVGHCSPHVPGCSAKPPGASVTVSASAASTRSGNIGRIVVSSSTRA